MAPDEDEDPDSFSPRESERVWFHPSEIGSLLPPASFRPGPFSAYDRGRARRRRALRVLAVPVLSGMVGAGVVAAALVFAGGVSRPATGERVIERVAGSSVYDLREPEGITQLVGAVAPAIVALRATTPSGERTGSGVVFRSDGHVLTNHHLVDGATSIELTAADGSSWTARLAGSDPENDLAVLAIPDKLAHQTMQPAVLGTTEALQVGQTAVVVGAPAGPQGSPSVSAGVIAGLGEVVDIGGKPFYDVITTDAMVGRRASGGPLVDLQGAVVGITTKVGGTTGPDGLGVVIPIDRARKAAEQLITNGRVSHAWLGLTGTDLDPWTAKEYGVSYGTLIRNVAPESPAARAGLAVSDVVTGVNGGAIATMNELMMLVRRHEPGERVTLKVARAGTVRNLRVKLSEAPGGH